MTRRQTGRSADMTAHLAVLEVFPAHETLKILSRKWLTLVVEALAEVCLGHAQIARRVPGATQKMLTETLRHLERDGLVTRHVTPSVPPLVNYRLTPLGHELLALQVQIRAWGERHLDEIRLARRGYDERLDRSDLGPA